MSSAAARSLAQDMLLAIRDQHLSDIAVVAFGQTFHLHRLILLRSGYFRSLILGQADWIEKSRQAVTLQFDDPYVNLEAFQRIIHWLYGTDCHYIEGDAPILFRTSAGPGAGLGGSHALARSASSQYHAQSGSSSTDNGRLGLGLHRDTGVVPSFSEKMPSVGIIFRRYDNIMLDPSDKVDALLISMFAAASYLNIGALMDELCSDISRRIRDCRGLIHYMEYAWRLNNGRAWDIILAQCFYTFFWNTYKSTVLQEMMVSPDMPLVGLIKVLVSESLYVPNEYERYHLVKRIMLRRLGLESEKLMNWVYDYHNQDWFMILKDLDDNGTWSYELNSDTFLNDLQDWESTSTTEYEDAVDTDHEWNSTPRELRRRSSQASTAMLFEESRKAVPTAEASSTTPVHRKKSSVDLKDISPLGVGDTEKKTSPLSPTLGAHISSPALSALSISDTLPRHQVRELLILMYVLHHSINYTHMSFDHLHQVLTDGLVLPSRIKDAFWRQHLLRRIAVSTSPNLPYLTAPSESVYGRYHGADPTHRERRTPITSAISRAKMTAGSTRPSPLTSSSLPVNSHGLLPIRFSTSLYISRQDLMTDGKYFTNATFYGGSWWSIQVGNTLNADGKVGVFLSSALVPRVVPNSSGGRGGAGRTLGGSSTSRSGSTGLFSAFASSTTGNNSTPANSRPPRGSIGGMQHMAQSTSEHGGSGDCSSVYSRARDLNISYRIYMTSNVPEPPERFADVSSRRLDEIRGSDYNQHPAPSQPAGSTDIPTRPHSAAGYGPGRASVPTSPDLGSTNPVNRSSQMISSEDEMDCNDVFKPIEGWGYKESRYLTRVAKAVRDQPLRSGSHSTGGPPPRSTTAHVPGGHSNLPFNPPLQQQQQQQQQQLHPLNHLLQQQQQQQQAPPQAPPLQQQHHHFPQLNNPQQQQPQHAAQPVPGNQGHQQGAGAHHQAPAAAAPPAAHAQGGPGHLMGQTHPAASSVGNSSSVEGAPAGHDETQDDGLWIHFVVRVGWADRKNPADKATN